MSEHTPGPWKLTYCEPTEECYVDFENGCATVIGEEVESKARLIAAAPKMLEAINLAIGLIIEGNPKTAMMILDEVAAEAKGETE